MVLPRQPLLDNHWLRSLPYIIFPETTFVDNYCFYVFLRQISLGKCFLCMCIVLSWDSLCPTVVSLVHMCTLFETALMDKCSLVYISLLESLHWTVASRVHTCLLSFETAFIDWTLDSSCILFEIAVVGQLFFENAYMFFGDSLRWMIIACVLSNRFVRQNLHWTIVKFV
jgi:hypothetical protein